MENDAGISPEIIQASPWIRDALEGAGAMLSSGVNAETVIMAVVAVPIIMRILNIVGAYVETHNRDLRATIDMAKLESRLKLRRHYPAEFHAEMEDGERQAVEAWKETK